MDEVVSLWISLELVSLICAELIQLAKFHVQRWCKHPKGRAGSPGGIHDFVPILRSMAVNIPWGLELK